MAEDRRRSNITGSESQRLALAAYESSRLVTEQSKSQNKQRDEEVRLENERVRQLQDEAYGISLHAPEQFKLKQAEQVVGGQVMNSLKTIKRDISMAKVPRGRIVRFFLCDCCGNTIKKPTTSKEPYEGFIIRGNIYLADPDDNIGLVGDNIPEEKESLVKIDHIKQTVLCKNCLLKALGIDKSSALKREVFVGRSVKAEDAPF